jgi:hypothetical protein
MAKTSTATEAGQEGSLRERLEAAIRERVREVIELILEEEVEAALGASRSQRVAERSGYRHGAKPRRMVMIRISILALVAALSLSLRSQAQAQAPAPTAVVHLKILYPPSGDDLGTAKVTLFKSESDGRDYAKRFRDNTASNIPYGVYHLRAYQDSFWSAERQVVVYQPDVWVVMGLQIGMDYELNPFKLSGTIRHLPPAGQPVWVRLTSVYSTFVMDTKVEDSGAFSAARLSGDKYVLIVWSGTKILDVRPVNIPRDEPLVIDLAQPAGSR